MAGGLLIESVCDNEESRKARIYNVNIVDDQVYLIVTTKLVITIKIRLIVQPYIGIVAALIRTFDDLTQLSYSLAIG